MRQPLAGETSGFFKFFAGETEEEGYNGSHHQRHDAGHDADDQVGIGAAHIAQNRQEVGRGHDVALQVKHAGDGAAHKTAGDQADETAGVLETDTVQGWLGDTA